MKKSHKFLQKIKKNFGELKKIANFAAENLMNGRPDSRNNKRKDNEKRRIKVFNEGNQFQFQG